MENKDKGMIICGNSFYEVRKAEFSRRDKQDERPHRTVPLPPPHCSDRQHLMTFTECLTIDHSRSQSCTPCLFIIQRKTFHQVLMLYIFYRFFLSFLITVFPCGLLPFISIFQVGQ